MQRVYIIKNKNKIELTDIEFNKYQNKIIGIDSEGTRHIVPADEVIIEEE